VLQTLHRKQTIEQHQPHYNWGEHRCSKHYTENTILNNTPVVVGWVLFNILLSGWNTCVHPSCSGVGVVQYFVFCVVFGAPVFTPVVVGWVLFNILLSGWNTCVHPSCSGVGVVQYFVKHYTENKIMNNTIPTTTVVNTGAPNTTQKTNY
jgi:hypothetical protein